MKKWNIGCSGFYYSHWKDIFYPSGLPKKDWFNFYVQHFNTLELNVTFYRFPKPAVFKSWYLKTPPDFVFTVKVPRLITHFKQFHDTRIMMRGYYDIISANLKEKLGCVLFQLPPRTAFTEEKLDRILQTLDLHFNNVLEFRHESWWNKKVYSILAENKISFCGMSHPSLPEDVIQNTPIVYYRFHGVEELYKSEYDFKTLKQVADRINRNKKANTAFLYFNNDIGGAAINNARQLQQYISSFS